MTANSVQYISYNSAHVVRKNITYPAEDRTLRPAHTPHPVPSFSSRKFATHLRSIRQSHSCGNAAKEKGMRSATPASPGGVRRCDVLRSVQCNYRHRAQREQVK